MSNAITLQSVFNAAWDHFIVKGNRDAAVSQGTCRYITEKGARCAVGLAFSEEQLNELVRRDETADTPVMLLAKHKSWFDETETRNGVTASYAYLNQLTSKFAVVVAEPEQNLRRSYMHFADALKYMQLFLHDKHTEYNPEKDKFVLVATERSLRDYYETVAKMLNLTIPPTAPEAATVCNQE